MIPNIGTNQIHLLDLPLNCYFLCHNRKLLSDTIVIFRKFITFCVVKVSPFFRENKKALINKEVT